MRELTVLVHLDVHLDDPATDAEIAREVGESLKRDRFLVADYEVIPPGWVREPGIPYAAGLPEDVPQVAGLLSEDRPHGSRA